jgi:hypothetical protein
VWYNVFFLVDFLPMSFPGAACQNLLRFWSNKVPDPAPATFWIADKQRFFPVAAACLRYASGAYPFSSRRLSLMLPVGGGFPWLIDVTCIDCAAICVAKRLWPLRRRF